MFPSSSSRIGGLPRRVAVALVILGTFLAGIAQAAPIQLEAGTVNMFRDTRGANNVGIAQADQFQYGANIVGGSTGTTLGADYPVTGFTDPQAACQPLAVSPSFCANVTAFTVDRIAQPWNLRFQRAGEADVVVAGPSLAGTEVAVPFPVSVTISGSGTTPTISWTIPGGFAPDAVRINIFDRGTILPNGQAQLIHSTAVAANAGSYAIPAALSAGGALANGGNYVFNVQLIDTRGDPAVFLNTNNNAEILRRSSSFFNFTPLSSGGPPQAFLPTVVNGVYNFAVQNVGPNSVTFIDPFVATGYDYAIGAGDPNFASVLLPTGIGDNLFDLFLWDGTAFVDSGIDLTGGAQYFFGGAGVSRFSIRGIEASAGLDPNNVAAFVTGLTFVANGNFTGTMTPVTVEVSAVPEPGSLALVLAALGAWGLRARAALGVRNSNAARRRA
jgi:hypothetical protein